MNRTRRAKGEAMLVSSESLLRRAVSEALPVVADAGSPPLFTNSKFNPLGLPAHRIDREAEALFDMASACIELREHLGVPTEGTVGAEFLAACEEAASADENRRGPRKLAQALLESLRREG